MLSQEQLARAAAVCPSLGLSLGALLWVWTGSAWQTKCFAALSSYPYKSNVTLVVGLYLHI